MATVEDRALEAEKAVKDALLELKIALISSHAANATLNLIDTQLVAMSLRREEFRAHVATQSEEVTRLETSAAVTRIMALRPCK